MHKGSLCWYPWYVNDWIASASVRSMNLEQQAAYRNLLDWQWQHDDCMLPGDDTSLSTLSGLNSNWKANAFTLLKHFARNDDGRVYNEKLRGIWLEKVALREIRIEQGKKGGRPRKQGLNKKAIAKPIAKPKGKLLGKLSGSGSGSGIGSGSKGKHLFVNDEHFDFNKFREALAGWSEEDVREYYESAKDYSASKGAQYVDWIATVRSWKRKHDKEVTARHGRNDRTDNTGESRADEARRRRADREYPEPARPPPMLVPDASD